MRRATFGLSIMSLTTPASITSGFITTMARLAVADVDGDGQLICISPANSEATSFGEMWVRKFEEITQRAGVGLMDQVSVAASFADVDNDGDPICS